MRVSHSNGLMRVSSNVSQNRSSRGADALVREFVACARVFGQAALRTQVNLRNMSGAYTQG
jgi:hypothetical protein